jgi:hypothetical protein
MTRPAGQLDRALTALTIGVVQGQRFRDRVLWDSYTGEYDQQVQLKVSGKASSVWGFADQKLKFDVAFYYAPTQRSVPFDRPHFTVGFELLNASKVLVVFTASVIRWTITNSGWITGATVRIASAAPALAANAQPEPFRALAHLVFQGYASYPDDQSGAAS